MGLIFSDNASQFLFALKYFKGDLEFKLRSEFKFVRIIAEFSNYSVLSNIFPNLGMGK